MVQIMFNFPSQKCFVFYVIIVHTSGHIDEGQVTKRYSASDRQYTWPNTHTHTHSNQQACQEWQVSNQKVMIWPPERRGERRGNKLSWVPSEQRGGLNLKWISEFLWELVSTRCLLNTSSTLSHTCLTHLPLPSSHHLAHTIQAQLGPFLISFFHRMVRIYTSSGSFSLTRVDDVSALKSLTDWSQDPCWAHSQTSKYRYAKASSTIMSRKRKMQ